LFYLPLFRELIANELKADMQTLGAKLQLAEVFHDFVLNVLPGNEDRKLPEGTSEVSIKQA
jgi:hypothetical protein